ncbi:prevent-host-death family protein [Anaerobacterium chartisolvens]|uniref:Antitoxin n=1 Tax=Anaerobacterium chartisolvens TaxID=1297424 RepID=A0A369ANS2_9FIRM|nr:type II toxin-antitoxin system Phd/YefM family antitoxin [Anaerobacterium chartisolvens]RCX09978.1 prevent-host-death family protein [Anaerobacterium chartisolvens]
MPNIRPISDLRNNANDISDFCHTSREPVFITKNGVGDMVIMSVEVYERQQGLINLYAKLAEAEEEIINGADGEDFFEVAKLLRESVHGRI